MKAVVITKPGGPEVLEIQQRERPKIGSHDVLIKVAAAGINRPDIIQREGKYPAPEGVVADIPGLEVSGEIVQVGSEVTSWMVGERVCALIPGGGYAQYVVADKGSCLPIPQGISLEDAAGLPETLFTVWHNVFQRGNLQRNERLFVYGGSGGIGSMAVQLGSIYGADVWCTAGSEEKVNYCKSLGASRVINYNKEQIKDLGSYQVDVILDSLGGEYFAPNIDMLKEDGRLVYINAMQGRKVELDIMKVMVKRISITGSTLRSRSLSFKSELARDIYQTAYPLLESGSFTSAVNYRFSLDKVVEAHKLLDSRDFQGKVVLIP